MNTSVQTDETPRYPFREIERTWQKRWADAYNAIRKWSAESPDAVKPKYQLGRMASLSGQYLQEGEAALRAYLKLPRAKA